MKKTVKIAAGAGFSGDRIFPAKELAEKGDIDYLIFECLAERSIALAASKLKEDKSKGYNKWLEDRFAAVLPACSRRGIKIITNMGAANPAAAGKKVAELARKMGITGLKCAVITGDEVTQQIMNNNYPLLESDRSLDIIKENLITANAYLDATPIIKALSEGADIVITGRVCDPSLFLAPLVYEFEWDQTDWNLMGKGTLAGHLLECSAHVTGGYYADPGFKDIPDPANIGFPIAEVEKNGDFVLTKLPQSGGVIKPSTCTEQTLYEVHDPSHYLTADCTANFSNVHFEQIADNKVKVTGATGAPAPEKLKVSVGYLDSYIGEGEISYCGTNAAARAKLALDMVKQRLHSADVNMTESRFDIIGLNAILRGKEAEQLSTPKEVRARIAGRTTNMRDAERICHEVEALWLNGPAGGGGASWHAREVIAIASVLIPRTKVTTNISYQDI